MTTQNHNLDKQMGCMAGFFQLFDRHQILNGKKFNSTKRLTSPSVSGSENSGTESSDVSKELAKLQTPKRPVATPPKAEEVKKSPKLTQPLQIFNLKEGTKTSWKFKETSRLSLDSRATYDAKGNIQMKEIRADRLILQSDLKEDDEENRRSRSSTSVIARLMGLEPISQADILKPAELRRCTSDSRFTRDLFNHRFIDGDDSSFPVNDSHRNVDPVDRFPVHGKSEVAAPGWKMHVHRKSFFEAEEAFPELPHKQSVSVYGEVEKKLKMRGIDEVAKDLDTLKQILEAWQLKGLLHSNINHTNVVYDQSFHFEDSNPGGGARRSLNIRGGTTHSISPQRERNLRSPTRTSGSENNVRRSHSILKSKLLTIETQNGDGSTDNRRGKLTMNSPSPRGSPRRPRSNQAAANRSPRNNKRSMAEIYQKEKITKLVVSEDESSSVSESSLTYKDLKVMDSKEQKNLMERCDKLLHSIGEMNATEQQSSPVSVLDSSFYESAASPSPIMKRNIHFKENFNELLEDEGGSPLILSYVAKLEDASEDGDLLYISEILRTCDYFPGDHDVFALLEKQQCLNGKDMSNKVSRLQRKLIFDTINEILERYRRLPPWKAFPRPPLEEIWWEFQRIKGSNNDNKDNDLVETVCRVVKKDLALDGWGECPVELSAVILDIERMIFRDLVTESIGECSVLVAPRRRLVF